jgi:hypothetical protein
MSSRAWRGDFGVPRACAICVVGRFSFSDANSGLFQKVILGCGKRASGGAVVGLELPDGIPIWFRSFKSRGTRLSNDFRVSLEWVVNFTNQEALKSPGGVPKERMRQENKSSRSNTWE